MIAILQCDELLALFRTAKEACCNNSLELKHLTVTQY